MRALQGDDSKHVYSSCKAVDFFSGAARFESRAAHRVQLPRFFEVFPQFSLADGIVPQIRALPFNALVQFVIINNVTIKL